MAEPMTNFDQALREFVVSRRLTADEANALSMLHHAASDAVRCDYDCDACADRELAPHPNEPHEFLTECRRCGERGMLHVAFITDNEVVKVEPRPALGADR